MKKIISLCSVLTLMAGLVGFTNGGDLKLENSNGVKISQKNYEKIKAIGLPDREINILTEEQYREYANLNIISISTEEKYAQSRKILNEEGEVIDSEVTYLTKEEMEEKLKEEETIKITPSACVILPPDFLAAPISNDYIPIQPTCGGSTKPTDPTGSSTSTTDSYRLYVTSTYYKNQGNQGTFKTRVNFEYLKTPDFRLKDVISINFSNNVQITDEYINGNQYAKFRSNFFYNQREYENFGPHLIGITPMVESRNGSNTSDYNYQIDKGLGVIYNLPNDDGYWDAYAHRYGDFYFTLEADFIPKQSNISSVTFAGSYSHMTTCLFGYGISNFNFSPLPPYITFSTSNPLNAHNKEVTGAHLFISL